MERLNTDLIEVAEILIRRLSAVGLHPQRLEDGVDTGIPGLTVATHARRG